MSNRSVLKYFSDKFYTLDTKIQKRIKKRVIEILEYRTKSIFNPDSPILEHQENVRKDIFIELMEQIEEQGLT